VVDGPIAITNTHSVGVVRDAAVAWMVRKRWPAEWSADDLASLDAYPNNRLNAVFAATVRATEEAIVNAMVAAETVIGVSGLQVAELPEGPVREIFRRAASQD
jgi:L-aminopeptidase/D-esterase-like protein